MDQRHRKTDPQVVVPASFLQDVKPANPRGAVFMPPFRNCPRPEVQGTGLPLESRGAPSTFVPPFRKTQPNTAPLGQGPGQPSSSRSGAPLLPPVFVPPFRRTSGSASHPGSEEDMSVQDRAAPHSACAGADSGQGPVNSNVSAGTEAIPEGPTLAPPSPGDHEPSGSGNYTMGSYKEFHLSFSLLHSYKRMLLAVCRCTNVAEPAAGTGPAGHEDQEEEATGDQAPAGQPVPGQNLRGAQSVPENRCRGEVPSPAHSERGTHPF